MSYPFVQRLAALVLVLVAAAAPAVASMPFAPNVRVLPDEVRLPRWEAALARTQAERPQLRACLESAEHCDAPRLAGWRRMMTEVRDADWQRQLDAVNRFVNTVPYVRDIDRFGVVDYWASPLEFFAGGGDCEDYAIAKYVSLRKLGVPAEAMRIVVLEDLARGIAHAVLAVHQHGRVWVLDNYDDKIRAIDALPHYAPYYAVNESQRWLHRLPNEPVPAARTR